MDAASPPDPAGESADILLALRHAMADPLSAAALKLDLVERRLLASAGAEPAWLMERVQGTKADLGAASRLLDLLLRLAEIAAERPAETSLPHVCLAAGVPIDDNDVGAPRLHVRQRSAVDAVRSVVSFLTRGAAVPSPTARTGFDRGRVTLALEGDRSTAEGRSGRLLGLPHGNVETEALFVARAAVAADGGKLELTERGGHLVALFSWPAGAREGGA